MNSNTHERPTRLPQHVAAVIFDFDETLIDLEPQHTAAYIALCEQLGSDYSTMPEEFRKGSGRRIIDDIRQMRAFFGWSRAEPELFEQRQKIFERLCRDATLQMMDGAANLIRALRARGVRQAITTSAVRGPIVEILERFELLDAFELIVDGSEVTCGKPDPEPYLVTTRKLRVDPAACVVFEDSNVGVHSARTAGTFCVAVANPKAQAQQNLSSADLLLPSLASFDPAWISALPKAC